MKPTPGPWETDERGPVLIVRAVEGGMAVIVSTMGRGVSARDRANGRLIAAAPDLLAALDECADLLTPYGDEEGGGEIGDALIRARDAIARARA